ncbi:MAG: hypothetical protein A2Z83_00765 [Omnitrophica bacterium GWA2_52_8]|nr:MAG: hypothetical protein A2Z83_00765 [Omnitrophica bacterium GWA2_52_8]
MNDFLEWANVFLVVFICISGVAAVYVGELVSASFLLSCFSFFLAILWTLLGAPDVGFTEAVVGSSASTIFFILALFGSKHYVQNRDTAHRDFFAFCLVAAVAGLFVWGSSDLPLFGSGTSAPNEYLSPYYLLHSYEHAKTPNAVTAIVVDYRGFDTLIESTVIFTAGIACLLIIQSREERILK